MNLTRSNDPIAFVISAGGSPGAYDIVRSLGIAGMRTSVASSEPRDLAFYSRYCGGRQVLPPFKPEYYQTILRLLLKFARRERTRPILYYASDAELSFVWRFREALEPAYQFLLPPDALLEPLFNKVLFAELAAKHMLPVPQAFRFSTAGELESSISSISFPCIVKPAFSQDWIWDTKEQKERFGPYKNALRRFDSEESLKEFCRALPQRSAGFLVQSYIEGRDEAIPSFHGYFDEQSRCLGFFLGRKIRTYPPHTGGSTYVETIENRTLAERSIEYLQRIGFQGIVKIDYKWNEQAGEFKILEVNPRYNLWQLLGAYAGINLAYIAYRHQCGKALLQCAGYKTGERLLYFKQDVRSFVGGYRALKEWNTGSYIQSIAKRSHYRVFALTDPMPFVISLLGFIRRNVVRLFSIARNEIQQHSTVVMTRVMGGRFSHGSKVP